MSNSEGSKELVTNAEHSVDSGATQQETPPPSPASDHDPCCDHDPCTDPDPCTNLTPWCQDPTPPILFDAPTDCTVFLSAPDSPPESNRLMCCVECQDPGSGIWRGITDLNGVGTTYAPFDGMMLNDEVTQSGMYLYRGRALYTNPNDPNDPIEITSVSIEVPVEYCNIRDGNCR